MDSIKQSEQQLYEFIFESSHTSSPPSLPSLIHHHHHHHTSSQRLRISLRRRTRARLRRISDILPTRRIPLYAAINARKRRPGRIQRHGPGSEDRVGESLVEVDGLPQAEAVVPDEWLRDELVEGVRGVGWRRGGEEVGVDGFLNDGGAGDGVGHDDFFDLGDVFGRGGGELLVGSVVGDEGGLVDGYAC